MMGRPVGAVRGPVRSLTDEHKGKLRKELNALDVFDGGVPFGW